MTLDRDTEIFDLVEAELERQNTTLQLIASENFTSRAVMEATGSVLTNKYSEGYPGKRYYGGNKIIDQVEEIARTRAKDLFGAEHANVQPHAGANANVAVYLALLEVGDTVLGLSLDHGGHLTHGRLSNISGRLYNFVPYKLTPSDERLDYDQIHALAVEHRPKMIVAGATAYSRIIDPEPFRAIADEVGALFMFDAAHIAGLIAGGAHPNPVPYADVVTLTTHKTLRGPRGGCILSKAQYAEAIDKAVMPGLQGGPLDHVIAAKAIAFREAADPSFRDYAKQIIANAQALAAAHGQGRLPARVGRYRQPSDARRPPTVRRRAHRRKARFVLDRAGITMNENTIPDDERSAYHTSGLRLGTAAMTTAGMKEPEMAQVAGLISRTLRHREDEAEVAAIRDEVAILCSKFTPYP